MTLPGRWALLPAALAAWLIYLALDFLSHAVLLAAWWRETADYWLPPLELFKRIPLGYASFAAYCAGLTWLLVRLYGHRVAVGTGLRFGLVAGAAFGLTTTLGAASILDVPNSYVILAPTTLTLESAVAGAVAAWVVRGEGRWLRLGLVAAIAVLLVALGVVTQNLFLATADARMIPR
jgi:hypothetical protein